VTPYFFIKSLERFLALILSFYKLRLDIFIGKKQIKIKSQGD